MAANVQARKSAPETMAEFIERRTRDVARFGMQAETAARKAYGEAIREGRDLALKTQAEVNRYGASLISKVKAQAPTRTPPQTTARPKAPPRAAAPQPRSGLMREAVDQTLAAARGAQDELTFGLGDGIYAGAEALVDTAKGKDFRTSFEARMAAERARDAYDAKRFGVARKVGEIAGDTLGLFALGPVDSALTSGVRMAKATALTGREALSLAGLGAGLGVVEQVGQDSVRGRRGSPGDYAGAAIGGSVGALGSLRGRPGEAAAMSGATTSVAQDVLNGRLVDWDAAGHAALAGEFIAAPLGRVVRGATNAMGPQGKGLLGEGLGRLRSRLNGDPQATPQQRLELDNGRITILDHVTRSGLKTEQKFGPSARLTPNQRAAYRQFGDEYRIDHFLPQDVGAIVGFPVGLTASDAALEAERE